MKPPLAKSLHLRLRRAAPLARLAGMIVLGCELHHLRRKFDRQGGARPSWPEFCRTQAGISEDEATRYYQCGEAVRLRLRFSHDPNAKGLLWAMAIQPSEGSMSRIAGLIERIVTIGLTDGDTEAYLQTEFEAAQPTEDSDERRLEANPWPIDDSYELARKWLRLKPVMTTEARRREAAIA